MEGHTPASVYFFVQRLSLKSVFYIVFCGRYVISSFIFLPILQFSPLHLGKAWNSPSARLRNLLSTGCQAYTSGRTGTACSTSSSAFLLGRMFSFISASSKQSARSSARLSGYSRVSASKASTKGPAQKP